MRLRGISAAIAIVAAASTAVVRDARACGGCFHPPEESGTVVTDHRMIFSVSPQQTSLYDEIKYSGTPSSFAWVLPVSGAVTVGVSSEVIFNALEQLTATQIEPPPLPPCPGSFCGCGGFGGSSGGSSGSGSGGYAPPSGSVTVISQQVVGPYAAVQLQSSDPNALNAWLTSNGYAIPADVQPIVAAYVADGFDFLALKLVPGQGIQAMRPIRVTSSGAGVSLPLRMVAAGTGATVGITLWVVGQGRYEPQNFRSFVIDPSALTWDWSTLTSDYATIRTQKEAALGQAAWQIESSTEQSASTIEVNVLQGPNDYVALPGADGGSPAGTTGNPRLDDLAALFPSGDSSVRITRLRADLSHAALTSDLVIQASTDQSTLGNLYQVTKSIHAPVCPAPTPCNCGGSSGSGSGSSGGVVSSSSGGGLGSSSGSASSGSDGTAGNSGSAANGHSAPSGGFSCAASASEPRGEGLLAVVAGVLVTALSRARRRRTP